MKLRDSPCDRCGWKFPGFHVCTDTSKPLDPQVARKHGVKTRQRGVHYDGQLENLAMGRTERWEAHHEANTVRNQNMVRRYKENVSLRKLAKEFGVAYQTAMGVIHRAAENGEVVVRRRGSNLRWVKEESADGVQTVQ